MYSPRVTAVTGGAGVLIITYIGMIGIRVSPVMLMTIDAFEISEIRGCHVAIAAVIPSPIVRSGIDREILGIMVPGGAGPV